MELWIYCFSGLGATCHELAHALESEIEAEKKLENDNLGGSASPSIPGFQILTKDAEVRLTKNFNDEK